MSNESTSEKVKSYMSERSSNITRSESRRSRLDESDQRSINHLSSQSIKSGSSSRSGKSFQMNKPRSITVLSKAENRRKSSKIREFEEMKTKIAKRIEDERIEYLDDACNEMWVVKPLDDSQLLTCISPSSRELIFERERRSVGGLAKKRRRIRRRNRKEGVRFYPIAKYYVYEDFSGNWYNSGTPADELDFQDYSTVYVGTGCCMGDYSNRYENSEHALFACTEEDSAKEFWAKKATEFLRSIGQKAKYHNSRKHIRAGFLKVIDDLEEILGDHEENRRIVQNFCQGMGLLFEGAPLPDITEHTELVEDRAFITSMHYFLSLSLFNKVMESPGMLKLFAHRYMSLDPEAHEHIIQLLKTLAATQEYLEDPIPRGCIMAFKKLAVTFLRNKMFIRYDRRRAAKLYEEGSSVSRGKFDATYTEYMYEDLISEGVLSQAAVDQLYPKLLLNEKWAGIDLKSFLMNPRKELMFQKSKWAVNFMKMLNSGVVTSLINNNLPLMHSLTGLQCPESVSSTITEVQRLVDDIAHNRLEKKRKPRMIRRTMSGKTNDSSASLKAQARAEEYFFDVNDDLHVEKALGQNFIGLLSPSSRNIIVKGRDAKVGFFDGYSKRNMALMAYVESNAFSPFLNAFVRADLQYSRRRHCCKSECSGHHGSLLITLIYLGNLESVKCLLRNHVRPNLKVCRGNTKELEWRGYETPVSQEAFVKSLMKQAKRKKVKGKGKIYNSVMRPRSWWKRYWSRIAFWRSTVDVQVIDERNAFDDSSIILKSRYMKVTPLGVALNLYGHELARSNQQAEVWQKICEELLNHGANSFFADNDAFRNLLPVISKLSERSRNMVDRNQSLRDDEQQRRSQKYFKRQRSKVGGISMSENFFNKIVTDINRKKGVLKRTFSRTGSKPSEMTTEEKKHLNLRGGSPDILPSENSKRSSNLGFLDGIVERTLVALREQGKSSNVELLLLLRVNLLFEAVVKRDFATFYFLAQPNTFLDEGDVIRTVGSDFFQSCKSLCDSIDPFTAESLYNVLNILVYSLTKTKSAQFHLYLDGITFIMQEYNVMPSRLQLSGAIESIASHICHSYILPGGSAKAIISFFEAPQVKHALLIAEEPLFSDRNLVSFTANAQNRRREIIVLNRSWKREAKRLRKIMIFASLKGSLFNLFKKLLKGFSDISFKQLGPLFIEVLFLRRDLTPLKLALDTMEQRFRMERWEFSEIIYQHCMVEEDPFFPLMNALIDENLPPRPELCGKFIVKFLKRQPFANNGYISEFDRVKDLSGIQFFHKLVPLFFDKRISISTSSTRAAQYLATVICLQDLTTDLANLSDEDSLLVWYEGINHLVQHLEGYRLTVLDSESNSKDIAERFTKYNTELDHAVIELKEVVEGNLKWVMKWIEAEKKLVMLACKTQVNGSESRISDMSSTFNFSQDIIGYAEALMLTEGLDM